MPGDFHRHALRHACADHVSPGIFHYCAFVDPSGGQADSFTLAIAHYEKTVVGCREIVIVDAVREKFAPFSPEVVVEEFAAVLKQYHIGEVCGDRYAGEWPREQFEKRGVTYRPSELSRSELYTELLPLLTSQRVELPVNQRLKAQFVSLERKTGRAADVIDHPPGGHDDLANCVAGVVGGVARNMSGAHGLIEFYKGLASGELRDPLAPPSLQERLAQRRAEVERQCVDPLAKYNQPPQANQTFIPRTRECSCGGTMQNEAADHMMYTCGKCGARVQINTDFAPAVFDRKNIAAQTDSRWQRGIKSFGRFTR